MLGNMEQTGGGWDEARALGKKQSEAENWESNRDVQRRLEWAKSRFRLQTQGGTHRLSRGKKGADTSRLRPEHLTASMQPARRTRTKAVRASLTLEPQLKASYVKRKQGGTSLVVQWQRLQTPNAGFLVQSLVRELDTTCHNEDLVQPNK